MKEKIIKSLKAIESSFSQGELAYLALTSKIERPIQDRFAFQLYKANKNNYIISREWRKTDVAILDDNSSPLALIELKAMYTFDAITEGRLDQYREKLKKDVIKAKKLANQSSEIYTILLATHPNGIIDNKYDTFIKWSSHINRAIELNLNAETVKSIAINNVNNLFSKWNCVSKGEISGGNAFNIETDVLYWIFKN